MFKKYPVVAIILTISLGLAACSKSDSSSSGSSGGSGGNASGDNSASAATGVALDAQNAVMADIRKHFAQTSAGWITARDEGVAGSHVRFLRQIKEITPESVEPIDVSDSDKLNGIDWNGNVTFKKIPCREAGEPGMAFDGMSDPTASRQRGQWSQWVEYQPEQVHVWKQKGQWQIDEDTWLLHGTIPGDQDFTDAGVPASGN